MATRGRPRKDMAALRTLSRHGFRSAHEVRAALTQGRLLRSMQLKIQKEKETKNEERK